MGQLMRSVAPTTEWTAFASRSEYLLDPDTPLRNPMTINYPGKDDPSVIPVHQGILERKKRYTKTYKGEFGDVASSLNAADWPIALQSPSTSSLPLDTSTSTPPRT